MTLLRQIGVAATAAALLPAGLAAQDRGAATGIVRDGASGQPLAGAAVFVEGTNYSTLSNAEGRFLLPNIPPGTHSLRAAYVGYGPVAQEFTVGPGGTTQVDFDLNVSTLQLDGIVVTATGEQRKRELPNSVADIDASDLVPELPANNLADLLQGRSAGVQVLSSAGTSGVGSRVRIRGASSISLSNDPLVYVDGIRVDSRNSGLGAGGQESSRLDDFNL